MRQDVKEHLWITFGWLSVQQQQLRNVLRCPICSPLPRLRAQRIHSGMRGESSERRQLPACGGANKREEAERRRTRESEESQKSQFSTSLPPSSLYRLFLPLHLSVTLGFRHQAHVSRTDVIYQGSAPPAAHPSLSSPSNTPAWATLSGS